jgi:glucokinase
MARKHYIGIDLGGTTFKLAVADADGGIVVERRAPTDSHEGPEAVLRRMGDEILRALDEAGAEPEALGLGLPGTIDMRNGVVKYLSNLPTHWPDVPVRDILQERIGCAVHILNDVRAHTLGELDYGLGRNARTMILLALGTGIGGGVVVDGRLRLGPVGSAGELGHMVVEPQGAPCGCGGRGCLETVASGPALAGEGVRLLLSGQAPMLRKIVEGDPGRVEARTMGEAARAGDAKVVDAIRNAATYLGIAISNLVVALHPDLVVIGGGVAGLGDLLFEPVRETVAEHVRVFPTETVRIEPSALGDRAGLMGTIALAVRGGLVDDMG